MGNGIPHIMSFMSAPWCSWTMLGLLLSLVFAELFQPGVVTQASSSLLMKANRTYKAAPQNFFGQVFISIFRIGTMALALCMCFAQESASRYSTFWIVCGVILAVLLVKMLCNRIIGYTFMLSRPFASAYEHYANIITIAEVVLFPCLLVLLRVGSPVAMRWVLGIISVLFLIMWVYRCARLFLESPAALFYVILYIVTLDILPLAGIYILTSQIIDHL